MRAAGAARREARPRGGDAHWERDCPLGELLAGDEDLQDWRDRVDKRNKQVEAVKATPEHLAYARARPADERLAGAPRTPDASDRAVSKRQWKWQLQQWRAGLQRWCKGRGPAAEGGLSTPAEALREGTGARAREAPRERQPNLKFEGGSVLEKKRSLETAEDRRCKLVQGLTDQLRRVTARISDMKTTEKNREELQGIRESIQKKISALTPTKPALELDPDWKRKRARRSIPGLGILQPLAEGTDEATAPEGQQEVACSSEAAREHADGFWICPCGYENDDGEFVCGEFSANGGCGLPRDQ